MNRVCESLTKAGLTVSPLLQDGKPVLLQWDPGVTGPILADRTLVVLPDMHLSDNANGDIFRGTTGSPITRLRQLLNALVDVKAEIQAANHPMSLLHIGDFYDVWRAYPDFENHPTMNYDVIENAYGDVIRTLTGPLDGRVCVGNHDAAMGLYPPSWARGPNGPTGRLAYAHTFASGRVFGFHGHQVDQLADPNQAQGGDGIVRLATILSKLSNPVGQTIQRWADLVSDFFSDSQLAISDNVLEQWGTSQTLNDTAGFHAERWSDRAGNEHVSAIVNGLPTAATIRLVFVGHSHRPGVSAITVGPQFVPVIDVGSWVWGRSQFAVAVEGEASLWSLGG